MTSALLTASFGTPGRMFERICQAFELCGYERPHALVGESGQRIIEQYLGRLNQAAILDILAFGVLTGSTTFASLRRNKVYLTQPEIAGLAEVFRERMFLDPKDFREGMMIRSVTGDPVGGGGVVKYEMVLQPEGITLWGIDNGGSVWYRYRPEEVISLQPEQVERLSALQKRLHEARTDLQKEQPFADAQQAAPLPDVDWYCQECGYAWDGPSGKSCPRCGETTMILSPRGRDLF